jgi:hypothetical protein
VDKVTRPVVVKAIAPQPRPILAMRHAEHERDRALFDGWRRQQALFDRLRVQVSR